MLGRMNVKFDRYATDEKGNIIVSFAVNGADRFEAKQCIAAINTALASGKERFKIDVDVFREKRSNQANAYFWTLCDKVAETIGSSKVDVYRKYITEQGVYRKMEIDEASADTVITAWSMHGTGWLAERVDYSNTPGFVVIFAYYGSSMYNKKQMARLIDCVVNDCREFGIETKTPAELAEMVSRWEVK